MNQAIQKSVSDDFYNLKRAVLDYCHLTAGTPIDWLIGYGPPPNLTVEQRDAWQAMHDAAWDKP